MDLECIRSYKRRSKIISLTGNGSLLGRETSRVPHFLDNRLTVDGKVVSLK
jgi:hypothetical protein